jgi:mutator protein MutT
MIDALMEAIVAAIFLNSQQELLMLKRAPHKKWYPHCWDTVAGKVEKDESPEECLKREVQEELGIDRFEILKKEREYIYQDGDHRWLFHLFLCQFTQRDIVLNEEHTEHQWVKIHQLRTVENISPPLLQDVYILFGV